MTAKTALLLFGQQPLLKNGKISGRAIHPVTTMHDEFPVLREFVAKHLEKAIEDSIYPFRITVDHGMPLDFTENKITELRWNPEKMEVEYFGEVSDSVAENIKNGVFKNGVSVEIDFPAGSGIDFVNGSTTIARAVPRGFRIVGLSLLKNMNPSDPTTNIEVWNNAVAVLQSQVDKNGGQNMKNGKIPKPTEIQQTGLQTIQQYGKSLKEQGVTKEEILTKIGELENRSQEIMKQLYPEAELADEQRDALNAEYEKISAEIAAYREALAVLTVDEILTVELQKPAGEPKETLEPPESTENEGEETPEEPEAPEEPMTKEKCEAAGGTWNDETKTCTIPEPEPEIENLEEAEPTTKEACESAGGTWDEANQSCKLPKKPEEPKTVNEAVELRKQLFQTQTEAKESKQKLEQAKTKFTNLLSELKNALPSVQAERSMRYGAQRFVQEIKRIIRESEQNA